MHLNTASPLTSARHSLSDASKGLDRGRSLSDTTLTSRRCSSPRLPRFTGWRSCPTSTPGSWTSRPLYLLLRTVLSWDVLLTRGSGARGFLSRTCSSLRDESLTSSRDLRLATRVTRCITPTLMEVIPATPCSYYQHTFASWTCINECLPSCTPNSCPKPTRPQRSASGNCPP